MIIEKHKLYINLIIAVLWVSGCVGFVFDELLPFLEPIKSPILFFCDIIMLFIGVSVLRNRIDIAFIAFFIAITSYSSIYLNGNGFTSYINGFRDFMPLLFYPPIFRYFLEEDGRMFDLKFSLMRFIKHFLILQIPCTVYQFVLYGAGDLVGGSLGHYNSGILTTMIIAGVFTLLYLSVDQNSILKSIIKSRTIFLFLLPAFLNETKVIFIFLILMGFFLIKIDRRIVFKVLLFIPVMCVLLIFSFYIYLFFTGNTGDILSIDYYSEMYLMNSQSVEYAKYLSVNEGLTEDVPRLTKIIEGFSLLLEENRLLWGFGIGQFKGGTTMGLTSFAQEYDWLLYGSVPYMFFLFIQGGLLICIWVAFWWLFNFRSLTENEQINSKLFVLSLFGVILLYNDSFRNILMTFVLLFIFFVIDKVKSLSSNSTN